MPELASLLSTATDAGPPNRAAAAATAQAAAAAAQKAQLRAPSGLPGLSANRDTRAARIFKAEERTEEDELVRRNAFVVCVKRVSQQAVEVNEKPKKLPYALHHRAAASVKEGLPTRSVAPDKC